MKNLMLKYRYAHDCVGNLLDINDVDKNNKGVYYCIHCKDVLTARLGETRIRHFAHKPNTNCNTESYLHVLGKMLFYDLYNKCLQAGNPFFIDVKQEIICTSCSQNQILKTNDECVFDDSKPTDLTHYFNEIYWEEPSNGFIADLMLKSKKSNEVIFIEIAVTHKCDEKKISSGHKIIEVNLKSDADIDVFNPRGLKSGDHRIKYYNFSIKQNRVNYNPHTCEKEYKVLAITKRRKPCLIDIPVNRLLEDIEKEKYLYFHILSKDKLKISTSQIIGELIEKYFHKGMQLRECLLCNYSSYLEPGHPPIKLFCQMHLEKLPLQYRGSPCNQFWQIYFDEQLLNYLDDYQLSLKYNESNGRLVTQELIDNRKDEIKIYHHQKEQGYYFIKIKVKQTKTSSLVEYVDCPKLKIEVGASQVAAGHDSVKLEDCERCKNYIGESKIKENFVVCGYEIIHKVNDKGLQ